MFKNEVNKDDMMTVDVAGTITTRGGIEVARGIWMAMMTLHVRLR